jgi:hypothetical protein
VDHEDIRQVCEKWRRGFDDLEQFFPPEEFKPRELVGFYAVASICSHGNDESVIRDAVFDTLCDWLFENFELCVESGADLLDKHMLSCHSGYALETFVKPYHDVASFLLGHECLCQTCASRN